jgi:hypothetical protein
MIKISNFSYGSHVTKFRTIGAMRMALTGQIERVSNAYNYYNIGLAAGESGFASVEYPWRRESKYRQQYSNSSSSSIALGGRMIDPYCYLAPSFRLRPSSTSLHKSLGLSLCRILDRSKAGLTSD